MTVPRLKTLVIENFRSLRGKVVIPLDAQVVLVHGSNGMGKTSVLSALELALTGKIAHLASDGDGYQSYLTTLETDGGSIELTTTGAYKPGGNVGGSLDFSDIKFEPTALLDAADARFFSERCYLPQATLGRLLEIYDDQKTGTTSPLTLFVKELLGLHPLDALVDGLYPAFNVARVRNLVPGYRQLETLRASLQNETRANVQSITSVTDASARRLATLNATLAQIPATAPLVVTGAIKLEALRRVLETARDEDRMLVDLSRVRSELKALTEQWRNLPAEDASHDRAGKERAEQSAAEALSTWRVGKGHALEAVLTELGASFADLLSIDDGPEEARSAALRRAEAEVTRCTTLLASAKTATDRRNALETIIQRATARIEELNRALSAGVEDAKSLANALAGIAPHVAGETCPVCDRNFGELDQGPLSAHIAAKIASLTSEAGRLQSLANERAEESSRLSVAQRDLLSAKGGQLGAENQADSTVRSAQMASAVQQLKAMADDAAQGTILVANAAAARDAVSLARRRDELSTSILPEIDTVVARITARQVNSFDGVTTALAEAERVLAQQIVAAEGVTTLRIRALSELELYAKDLNQIADLKAANALIAARLTVVEKADVEIGDFRAHAKKIADSADKVRSDIVKAVFNTSLNAVWRDLFVRLAPFEQFVPTFKLPASDSGKVEAVLETLHRSGKASGSPGAMLSQGNLNTAALTLFLALHLSVPSRMPWLVLDDPVQSMDDVHIAQFAALLRTFSKGMGRQLVVAVHERALFDYLTLELSPAFPGDSLISIEITRNFDGDAVATPQALSYEEDRAIAA
ncbi:AAA family ATPase [Mesorhizobium sp. M0491]|uniref:AAA family ATPase n=1 Tax=Mesorhizobium sp. M0491 TaxID=2956950 RepID=UPI0033395529